MTVSRTRWTRRSLQPFSTRCQRKLSNNQHSPAAMWTVSSPQVNSTFGSVMTGMWIWMWVSPMIMDVDVQRNFASWGEAHQAASAPDSAEFGHRLLDVGQPREVFRRPHRTFEVVSRLAGYGDQPDRLVARVA